MKTKKFIKIALAAVLCLAMLLPFLLSKSSPATVEAQAAEANDWKTGVSGKFEGKYISILGDSISTYAGVSNDSTANSTIGSNKVYYTADNAYGVDQDDTWWQQAIDALDMQLCVNNSYSGSGIFSTLSDAPAAWIDRCVQLDTDAGVNPDIVAVYLGTNDMKNRTAEFTVFDYDNNKTVAQTMIDQARDDSYPDTKDLSYDFSLYIRMIDKILSAYSTSNNNWGVQVYCFTLLPNESQVQEIRVATEAFNQSIRNLVDYYQNEEDKRVYLVDLYNDSGITSDLEVLDTFLANTLHPNDAGMDAITNCFLSALVQNPVVSNSGYWYDVTYELDDVYVAGGQIGSARHTSASKVVPFSVDLVPTHPEYGMDVKVTMVNSDDVVEDITASAYAGSKVYIEKITGPITITANATYDTKNYRWELEDGVLESCVEDGTDYNIVGGIDHNDTTLISGSYEDNLFVDQQLSLRENIILRNNEPWVIEWKANGTWDTGSVLFCEESGDNSRNNTFVYFTSSKLSFGYYKDYNNGGNYPKTHTNFGVAISGINDNASHIYRLVNVRASDGSNMIHLYIDESYVGALNSFTSSITDDWVSGRDFSFSYFGSETSTRSLNNCNIEYIQVWEGGEFDTLRLEQLILEYDELSATMDETTPGFTAYQKAVSDAKTYMEGLKDKENYQTKYDSLVTAIVDARNELTSSSTVETTEIYSVELLSRNYVAIGMPAGLKIITTPNVERVQVGNTAQTLLTNSSSLQTIKIDGKDTEVKVWLVTWKRSYTTEKIVEYRIHAVTDSSKQVTSSTDSDSDASIVVRIPFGVNCISELRVTTAPTKTTYKAGESFDATGMVVKACYGDGSTTETVTDYEILDGDGLTVDDTYVTLKYTHATYGYVTTTVPITVTE